MTFFTRPDLDDRQFRQETGSTLQLSGETNFQGVLKSKDIEIDATVVNATAQTGQVLTFDGTKIQLEPSSGGSNIYNGETPSTITVGGIPAGTTLTGRTYTDLFQQMLVVFQEPTFSSFTIGGLSVLNEVGNPSSFSGNKTFNWATTNSGNVSANTITITDVTGSATLGSGLANDGTESLNIGTISNISPISQQWKIDGLDIEGSIFSKTFNISSIYPWFYGKVVSGSRPVANQSLINSGTKVVASSTGSINVSYGAITEWIWFAIPFTSNSKTKWTGSNSPSNTGSIGGAVSAGGNLFPDPDVVAIDSPDFYWSGVNYKIYISNFQTSTFDGGSPYSLTFSNS